jgi:hypothetical protein
MQSSVLLSSLVGILLFVGSTVGDGSRSSPVQGETREILIAAVGAVRPQLDGTAAVEASRLCEASLADWDCPSEVSQALDRLRLTPTSREFAQACPSGEESCRLVGVRHLMIPGMPQLRGATAQVTIEVVSDTGGGGLRESAREVHLARRDGRWSVVRVD